MNRDRLNQIVRILLLPYSGSGFETQQGDVIKNVRSALYDYTNSLKQGRTRREKSEKNYLIQIKKLENYISSDYELRTKTIDDMKLLLELFYPEEKILALMEKYSDSSGGIERYYIENIFRIASSLLTFRDGKIAIRTWMNPREEEIFYGQDVFDKVEIWNILCRIMVPDVFIVAFFILSHMAEPCFLYNQNGGITLADKVLDRVLKQGFAETHMHMNAGAEYSVYWQGIMTYAYWSHVLYNEKNYMDKKQEPYMFIYRVLFAGYLKEKLEYDSLLDYIKTKFQREHFLMITGILNIMHQGKNIPYDKKLEEILEQIYLLFVADPKEFDYGEEFLLQTVYYMDKIYKTSGEMIFLMEALKYLQEDYRNEFEMQLFMQYLRMKNKYFGEFIQSGYVSGLSNFRYYFGNAADTFYKQAKINATDILKIIFKGQSHNINLKKMEVRISPKIRLNNEKMEGAEDRLLVKKDILKKVQTILRSYVSYVEEMTEEMPDKIHDEDLCKSDKMRRYADHMYEAGQCAFPTVGIVFHFIKKEYLDNRIGDMCWLQYDEEQTVSSKHLLIWRKKLIECAKCIEELRSSIPYLSDYIVGIDAASEENSTEPWIMSAVYKAVRNKSITKALIQDRNLQFHRVDNLGFTYHVGEEFRHILSGLRHIDEVIDEFNYKAGDRLGHAIALGEDIDFWVRNNEVITIPVMEWMENLLWVWGRIVQDNIKLKISATYLEGKIMELAQEIYGESEGMTPLMLYQAYKAKFKIDHTDVFQKQKKCIGQIEDDSGSFFRKILCKYYTTDAEKQRWSKEKIVCSFFCPVYNMRFRKPILIRTAESLGTDALKEIQRYLIQKVEYLGIYVETNPTSNITINGEQGLLSHYILNLNSEGLLENSEKSNAVMVTVNTDDPIVFNTSIENELSYIYYLLVHKKYKKERVLKWIDKIRQNSLESSFIKNIKLPSQQLYEIKSILNDIDKFLKNGC